MPIAIFEVQAVDRNTGTESRVRVTAATSTAAREAVSALGYIVGAVRLLEVVADESVSPTPTPTPTPTPEAETLSCWYCHSVYSLEWRDSGVHCVACSMRQNYKKDRWDLSLNATNPSLLRQGPHTRNTPTTRPRSSRAGSMPSCPKCGSKRVDVDNTSVNVAGALLGAALLGPVGLLGAFAGPIPYRCSGCGTRFQRRK